VAELTALDRLAAAAVGGEAGSPAWEAWVAQLRRVFAAADDACRALTGMLAEPSVQTKSSRRWFGAR
jgi:hypothetical protein